MYPRDFFEGTQRMSLELKGAYIMLLNLIYTRNGPVDDEDGYLARYVGCSIRKWQKLRLELIGLGKIAVADGMIRNSRADEELLKRTSYVDQKRENRARPNKIKDEESHPRTTRGNTEPEPELEKKVEANASTPQPTRRRAPKPVIDRHFMADDWWPSEDDFEWAANPKNTRGIELTREEVENETNQCKRWFLDRRDEGNPVGKRPGHTRSWQTWICKSAPEILRARPRTPVSAFAGRANGTQFAPKISQHDAFALAALKASGARGDAGRQPDNGNGAGPLFGPAGVEILDFGDDRGAEARRAGGNREPASAIVRPLSAAGGR